MIDLDFFCWREPTKDVEGNDRLLVPWSNPMQYEHPFDSIFATAKEAEDFRDEMVEPGACILDEADILAGRDDDCSTHEHEDWEAKDWVLVHYVGTIVPTFDDVLSPLEDTLERALELGAGTASARLGVELFTKVDRIIKHDELNEKQLARLIALRGTLLEDVFKIDGERCDECGAFIPANQDVQNTDHSTSCSLHPDNEVMR